MDIIVKDRGIEQNGQLGAIARYWSFLANRLGREVIIHEY